MDWLKISTFSYFPVLLLLSSFPPALSFRSSTYLRHASANSHSSFRALCLTQALLRCELLFSLSRSSELSFVWGPAFFFLFILVIIQQWLFTPKALNFFIYLFFVKIQIERKKKKKSLVVGNRRWMCRSAVEYWWYKSSLSRPWGPEVLRFIHTASFCRKQPILFVISILLGERKEWILEAVPS